MLRSRRILLTLALGAALCGCDTQYSHATPQAAQELAQLMQEIQDAPLEPDGEALFPDWEAVVEFQQLYERFQDADDTRLTTPGGVSILHAACYFKKPELARCLLADGADPNAASGQSLTPLLLAVGTGGADHDEDTVLHLLDVLFQAGAEPVAEALDEAAAAECAGKPRERVFESLLAHGCPPSDESVSAAIQNGWHGMLLRQEAFVKAQTQETINGYLLSIVSGDATAIIETLAAWSPQPERLPLGAALSHLAGNVGLAPEGDELAAAIATSKTLLRMGADPYAEDAGEHGMRAADVICAVPPWADALRQAGYDIQPRPIEFTEGEALHDQVIRADLLGQTLPAGNTELFDTVAGWLTETHEDEDCCAEHNIHSSGLAVLNRTDPQRTAAFISALPVWRDWDSWEKHGGSQLLPAMSYVAADCGQSLSLPVPQVCRIAGQMDTHGMPAEACALLSLLSATPTQEAADALQRYAADAMHPALQAGAVCALVRRAHLPQPEEGAVEAWLEDHPDAAARPAVQTACLLTSTARLWGGQMRPDEQQRLLQAMRDIGAAEAAEKHEAIIKALDNPEALDELESGDPAWKFRFKARIGEFILRHRGEFSI